MKLGTWEACALSLLVAAGLSACGGPDSQETEAVEPLALEGATEVEQQAVSETTHASGALRWAHPLAGPAEDTGRIVADRDGGYLAMVNFKGSIDLGNGPVVAPGGSAQFSMALARYDVDGKLRWVKVFSTPAGREGIVYGIHHAMDSERNIILYLEAEGVDLGHGLLAHGFYLVKLDHNARLRWLRPVPKSGIISVGRVVTDRENRIALMGDFGGVADFGSGPVSSHRTEEGFFNPSAFVTLFSPRGENVWTFVDDANQSQGLGGTADSEGNFYLCGTVFTGNQTDPFLLQLSPQGTQRWVRRINGAAGFAWSVATHGNRVVIAGTFALTFRFAGHTHTATPNSSFVQDAFVAAFTRSGEERWAWNFGFEVDDIAMDQNDGVTVVGSYQAGSSDLGILGPLPGNPESLANVYVAKFDRIDGALRWSRGFSAGLGSPGLENGTVAVTKDGRPAAMGNILTTLTVGGETWTAHGRTDVFLLGFER